MTKRKQTPRNPRQQRSGRDGSRPADSPGRPPRRADQRKSGARPSDRLLYGLHAVSAALANPSRRPRLLMATKSALTELKELGLTPSVPTEILEPADLATRLPPGAVHQGLALDADPLPELDLHEALEGANRVLILDQVTDPHNVGAILRSAAVFGAAALVMTDRNSPPLSGVLAKAASGAAEHVALVRVVNLVRALEEIKEIGFTVIGLDGEAPHSLPEIDVSGRVALVLGAEGAGLRRLTREHCDWLARLPASGPMRSLNVSNAAAVALYEVARRA